MYFLLSFVQIDLIFCANAIDLQVYLQVLVLTCGAAGTCILAGT